MKKLLLTFLVGVSASLAHAQATNTAPKTRERLQQIIRRGILVAVDKQKQTVSIAPGTPATAGRDKIIVYFLTPETKFRKEGIRATLEDAVIGGQVFYSIRPGREEGRSDLTLLQFVPEANHETKK